MKKLVLLMLLAAFGLAANAQSVKNNTLCAIVITPICYDPVTCAQNPCTSSSITVAAGSSATLPNCPCSSATGLQGYQVCILSSGTVCHGCATIGDATGPYPCPDFQSTATLSCPRCSAAVLINISWNSAGNMIVQ